MDQVSGGGGGTDDGGWALPGAPVPSGDPDPTRGPDPTAESIGLGGSPVGTGVRERAAPPPPLPVPLRPMGLVDMLDGSVRVLRQRPRPMIALAALLYLPIQVAVAFHARSNLTGSGDLGANAWLGGALDSDGTLGWVDFVALYAALLPLPFLGAFVALMVVEWYGGVDVPTGDLVRRLVARVPALLGAWLITHLALTVAALPLGIPLLFAVPMFLFVAPVIAVEGLGPIAGIRRAWRLAARRYWSCFWLVIATAVVSLGIEVSLSVLPSILAEVLGPERGWPVLAAGGAVAALVSAPFVVGTAVLAYLDARVRLEGLDVEMRAVEVLGRTVR